MGKSKGFWMRGCLSAVSLTTGLGAAPALAQSDAQSASNSIWQRPELLGDMGGLRPALSNYGITLGINDSENLLANLAGGVKTGATMQGVTTMDLDADMGKMIGLQGGTFHISALQIHGRPLSPFYLDNLQAANGNEAENTTRLWEMWYDQSFDKGLFDIKIGQQSIDNEYMISQYSALFVNTMAGWPLVPSENLYGGGPAYPLSSLGVRIQVKPTDNQTILAGVFNDNPGGGAFSDDAQQLDRNGAKFNLNTGALWIAEYQYTAKPFGLPGTYKLGFWYDSGSFPDQRFGTDGLSLADPDSNGDPMMHIGNHSFYAVVDQTVWQSASDSARNINIFGRIMNAPTSQNLITFFFNGGVTMAAPLPGRDNDQAGIDFGVGTVSSRTAELDADSGQHPRGSEGLIELTYQAQVLPWLVVQPDMQYIVNPGGGAPNPNNPDELLKNEFVIGARMITTF